MSLDHRRLDVFGAWLHRILCHLGFIFRLFRKRRSLRSIIGNTLRVVIASHHLSVRIVLLGREPEPEVEAELLFMNLTHLVLDELERELGSWWSLKVAGLINLRLLTAAALGWGTRILEYCTIVMVAGQFGNIGYKLAGVEESYHFETMALLRD
ncbi:hypothetical protein Tco_0413104 [Tanacetum coccineum]